MTSLWAAVTLKRRLGHPNRLHFLNPESVRIPWVVASKNFPGAFYPKNHFFANFRAHTLKQCSGLLCAQFWCHWPSTSIVWSVTPQSFQGHPRSWPGVNGLASRSFQSQVTQICVHQNRRKLGVFCTKSIFLAKRSIVAYSYHTYSESSCSSGKFGISGDPRCASCDL